MRKDLKRAMKEKKKLKRAKKLTKSAGEEVEDDANEDSWKSKGKLIDSAAVDVCFPVFTANFLSLHFLSAFFVRTVVTDI